MTEFVIYTLVAFFVGWNLPQPSWAAAIQKKVTDFVKQIKNT